MLRQHLVYFSVSVDCDCLKVSLLLMTEQLKFPNWLKMEVLVSAPFVFGFDELSLEIWFENLLRTNQKSSLSIF